jgi:hypothetical protein
MRENEGDGEWQTWQVKQGQSRRSILSDKFDWFACDAQISIGSDVIDLLVSTTFRGL